MAEVGKAVKPRGEGGRSTSYLGCEWTRRWHGQLEKHGHVQRAARALLPAITMNMRKFRIHQRWNRGSLAAMILLK